MALWGQLEAETEDPSIITDLFLPDGRKVENIDISEQDTVETFVNQMLESHCPNVSKFSYRHYVLAVEVPDQYHIKPGQYEFLGVQSKHTVSSGATPPSKPLELRRYESLPDQIKELVAGLETKLRIIKRPVQDN